MHQTLCHGRKGLCKEMVPVDGSELLKYLRKVEFTGDLIGLNLRSISYQYHKIRIEWRSFPV